MNSLFFATGKLDQGDLGLAVLPNREEEFMDGMKKSLEYAKGLGCRRYEITRDILF